MKFNWLFVVQNFETRAFDESAASVEIIKPLLESGFVNNYQTLTFNRHSQAFYSSAVRSRVADIVKRIATKPVVIYGAGIHTQQYLPLFKALNVVAITDRDESLWGSIIEGLPIISPAQLPDFTNDVLISSKAFEDSIHTSLTHRFPMLSIHCIYRDASEKKMFQKNMASSISQTLMNSDTNIVFFSPSHPADNLTTSYWLKIKRDNPTVKFVTLWWDYDEDEEASSYLSFERDCLIWNDLCIDNSNGTRLSRMKDNQFPYDRHTNTHKVDFFPTVFSEDFFYADKQARKKYEIAIFGSAAGNRKTYIDQLRQLYGDRFIHLGGMNHQSSNVALTIADYAQAIRESTLVINTQTYPFRTQCKGKVRETLACEILLLEEENEETRLLLNDEEGIVYFKDFDDLVDKIEWLSKDVKNRERIIHNGTRVWGKIGTSAAWAQKIINKLFPAIIKE